MRRLLAALTLCLVLLCPVALPVAGQQRAPAQSDQQTQTVYVTRTGKKYHRDGCRYLASSKFPISLKEPRRRGTLPARSVIRQSNAADASFRLFSLAGLPRREVMVFKGVAHAPPSQPAKSKRTSFPPAFVTLTTAQPLTSEIF